jgi:hypothetical protein
VLVRRLLVPGFVSRLGGRNEKVSARVARLINHTKLFIARVI